ncbi:flagellar hook-associated family protein [Liberibacter crescens]|nr:flagellar hook-associated family protein [Liberibacter crescens]AMC13385.1 hypothetical protein RL73_04755 [Liberibacter crescens]
MKTTDISMLSLHKRASSFMKETSNKINKSYKEIITEQHADFGTKLGMRAAETLEMRQEIDCIKSFLNNNALTETRLDLSQKALENMATTAQDILNTVSVASGNSNPSMLEVVINTVKDGLSSFTGSANTSANGKYIFSGINSGVEPLKDYFSKDSLAKKAFDSALKKFLEDNNIKGINGETEPSAMNGAQMLDFINQLEKSFADDKYWSENWSNASSKNIYSRINKFEYREVSTNVNVDAVRKFSLLSVLSVELLKKDLGKEALNIINEKVVSYAGQVVGGINEQRSNLGFMQSRIHKTNMVLNNQQEVLQKYFSQLVGVNRDELSVNLQEEIMRLDLSYSMTAKLLKLSIANYL